METETREMFWPKIKNLVVLVYLFVYCLLKDAEHDKTILNTVIQCIVQYVVRILADHMWELSSSESRATSIMEFDIKKTLQMIS